MFTNKAKTVAEYLGQVDPARRALVESVLAVVRESIPRGYVEEMNWGAITWAIPLSVYPDTYNKQPLCYTALAAQKHYVSLYLMPAYGSSAVAAEFKDAYRKAGKKLDMGKSCLHLKSMDDLEIGAVKKVLAAFTPAEWIQRYELSRQVTAAAKKRAGKAKATRKPAAKKSARR